MMAFYQSNNPLKQHSSIAAVLEEYGGKLAIAVIEQRERFLLEIKNKAADIRIIFHPRSL